MKNNKIKKIKIIKMEKKCSGLPAAWEKGGAGRNTGYSQIICTRKGAAKKPVYIKKTGNLSNHRHALFVMHRGDVIINCDRHHDDYKISIVQVDSAIDDVIFCLEVAEFEMKKHQPEYPPTHWCLFDAIEAAMQKSEIYHCRQAVYILQ